MKSNTSPVITSEPKYISKTANDAGYIDYSVEENGTWKILYERQTQIIQKRACKEFLHGLSVLNMSKNAIPQLPDINNRLRKLTGWQVERVPALIGFERFFELLANRKFPAATFIRRREELDYIREPDIFHELFGHCPLLTNQNYADFSQHYGQLGLAASNKDRAMLARLYWFTIEFGLVREANTLKIYGGGILSSTQESCYSLESDKPVRTPLDVIDLFRTHYRIDQLQKNYFIIEQLADLQQLTTINLKQLIERARFMGMKASNYDPNEGAAC